MSELTIGQLIKIILGVLVVIVVVAGIYLFFRYNVIDFFRGIGGEAEESPSGISDGTGLQEENEHEQKIRKNQRKNCDDPERSVAGCRGISCPR